MGIYLASLGGSASIGVYSLVTDKIVIIPKQVPPKKAERFAQWLKVKLVHTSIGGSTLIGALSCANSNGILLPNYVREEEVQALKRVFDGNITIMKTKKTAYGNMVLTNDFGAVADPRLKKEDTRVIAEALGVEVVPAEIANLPYVGSLAVATNKGVLAHPLLRDEEKEHLQSVLKVPVDVGTINCGVPYVGSGLLCNSYAAVAGSLTTGPEIFIIGNALDVVRESEEVESLQSYR